MNEIESSPILPEGESENNFREQLKNHFAPETLESITNAEPLNHELRRVRERTPDLQSLFWVDLSGESNEGKINFEGKLYVPQRPNGEIIIYEPGGPGNIDQFEEKFISPLIEAGYTIFTDRHNGALANDNNIIHSQERIRSSRFGKVLGGEGQRGMSDWLNQPAVAAGIFSSSFERISFVAHSFGCLDVLVSLKRMEQTHDPTLPKVKRAILGSWAIDTISDSKLRGLRPPLGGLSIDEIWGNWAQEMREQGIYDIDSQDSARAVEKGVSELSDESHDLPKDTTYILSTPTNDEVVDVTNFPNLQNKVKQGIFISDETQKKLPEGQIAHDQPRTEPKNLLRVLRWEHPGHMHNVRVKKSEES